MAGMFCCSDGSPAHLPPAINHTDYDEEIAPSIGVSALQGEGEIPAWFNPLLTAMTARLDRYNIAHHKERNEMRDTIVLLLERLTSIEQNFCVTQPAVLKDKAAGGDTSPRPSTIPKTPEKPSLKAATEPEVAPPLEETTQQVASRNSGPKLVELGEADPVVILKSNSKKKVVVMADETACESQDLEEEAEEDGTPNDRNNSVVSGNSRASREVIFTLKECWLHESPESYQMSDTVNQQKRMLGRAVTQVGMIQGPGGRPDMIFEDVVQTDEGWKTKIVQSPNTTQRFCWDIISMFLIGLDFVVIPLQFFSIDMPLPIQWCVCLFWTCDLFLSFTVGYYSQGVLEMRLTWVLARYARTWMLFDVTIVTVDWLVLSLTQGVDANETRMARISKSLRVVRTLRSLRLLRLAKMKRVIDAIKDRLVTEASRTLFNVLSLVLLIVAINHVIACGWYGVGNHHRVLGYPNWVQRFGYDESDFDFTYMTSFHWSLTQFTPATMEVHPQNTSERVYAVQTLLFALVIFSSFVSILTSALTRFYTVRSDRDRQFEMLRRFLRDKQVSNFLASRVTRYVEHIVALRRSKMEMKDVALLEALSKPLRMDLDSEIHGQMLSHNSFFRHYSQSDTGAMRRVCHTCLTGVHLAPGDLLFSVGERCSQMFFVVDGSLTYHHSDPQYRVKVEDALHKLAKQGGAVTKQASFGRRSTMRPAQSMSLACLDEGTTNLLEPGDFCCEVALWTKWEHHGKLRAEQITKLMALNAEAFESVTLSHRQISQYARRYGRAYLDMMTRLAQEGVVSDLQLMETESLTRDSFYGKQDKVSRYTVKGLWSSQ